MFLTFQPVRTAKMAVSQQTVETVQLRPNPELPPIPKRAAMCSVYFSIMLQEDQPTPRRDRPRQNETVLVLRGSRWVDPWPLRNIPSPSPLLLRRRLGRIDIHKLDDVGQRHRPPAVNHVIPVISQHRFNRHDRAGGTDNNR